MKKESALKAKELIEEIKDLERYKEFLKGSHKYSINFQINEHYGKVESWEYVTIDKRHNDMLFKVVENILLSLEEELQKLN